MKAVNVDDVLKILHKYGKYIFVTDEKRYSSMVDEIANLKPLPQETVTEFADRCRECGAHYGKLLKKSEWEHDHEILKAHSDGANDMLDKIRDRVELERIGYPPSEGYCKAITKVLQIIDEYSEGSDSDECKTES